METNDQHADYIAAHNRGLDELAAITAAHERTTRVTQLTARHQAEGDTVWSAQISAPTDTPPATFGTASGWMAVHVLAVHDDIDWLLDERLRLQGLLVDAEATITDLHSTVDALVVTNEQQGRVLTALHQAPAATAISHDPDHPAVTWVGEGVEPGHVYPATGPAGPQSSAGPKGAVGVLDPDPSFTATTTGSNISDLVTTIPDATPSADADTILPAPTPD